MPEKLLNAELIKQIKLLFETQLIYPVEIIDFSDKDESESYAETSQLLEELCALSDKLSFQHYEIHDQPQLAQKFNVSFTPGLVIASRERDELLDYGIRFAGIPSGYEFGSLVHAIELVSRRDSGLKPETRLNLQGIHTPILLQVFVTPT